MSTAKGRRGRVRKPQQERSRQCVEAILEATCQILESKGAAGLTTRAIAARAGIGLGSIYHYFPNRDAIISEFLRKYVVPEFDHPNLAAARAAGAGNWVRRGLTLDQRLRRMIEFSVRINRVVIERFGVEFHQRYGGRLREFLGLSPEIAVEYAESYLRVGSGPAGDVDTRMVSAVLSASQEMVSHIVSRPGIADVPTAELVDEISRLLLPYLKGERGSRWPSEALDRRGRATDPSRPDSPKTRRSEDPSNRSRLAH